MERTYLALTHKSSPEKNDEEIKDDLQKFFNKKYIL
jgi:hypothetical protein